jgi:hypothetical protein
MADPDPSQEKVKSITGIWEIKTGLSYFEISEGHLYGQKTPQSEVHVI